MNRWSVRIVLSSLLLLLTCGSAFAETVKGEVKSIAAEAMLFSLITAQQTVLLFSWDGKTAWQGIGSAADLKPFEIVTVDYAFDGDNAVAVSVARLMTPVPAGIARISLAGLVEKLNVRAQERPFVLVDTRSAELFAAGHIAGAVSIPLVKLERRAFRLLPEDKTSQLIVYDAGQAGESAGKSAEILINAGYTNTAVFVEGVSGWTDSGRFLSPTSGFIRKEHPLLIDIRSQEKVQQGHIAAAINIPAARLKDYYSVLPEMKQLSIVIYGDTDKDAFTAAGSIRQLGYRNVTVYSGGVDAWVRSDELLETGPAMNEIPVVRATRGGSLPPDQFEKALLSIGLVELVDVRPAAIQKKASFPEVNLIPLAELTKRHRKLKREKIQVIFATDVDRGEMAYDFLRAKGYRATYLNGSVEFGKDGTYTLK